MKFEIMMGILFELMSKKCVKASYLAQKFEVSIRSIHRYINNLEMSGVPIYTMRGNQGGFAIIDTFKLSSTFFTKSEFEQTINALTAINEGIPNKVLESAILKLKSAVRNEYCSFSLQSGNLIIDAGPWGDTTGYKSKLVILQKSIDECKKLHIRYHDRNGEITDRTIEPHLIVFKQGIWYTFAYCTLRNEFRFFKTGRIESANILDEKFTRRDLTNMDLPTNFWHSNLESTYVLMEIDKSCLSDVEEWLGIENVKKINGKYIADVNLPFDKGLISKIISFGSGIKVLEPKILKDKIKNCVKEIYNNY